MKGYGALYVPVSSNAGVFRVDGGQAVATDPQLVSLKRSGAAAKKLNGKMSIDPSELLALTPKKS